jgi:class 3 adenylate cyclase/tetratricopeptide (TPR) repeat protein
MQCPKCQFENPTGINFCGECGAKLERLCPGCKSPNPLNFKFCGECGHNLISTKEISEEKSEAENLEPRTSTKKSSSDVAPLEGERKHVTVLFSDLTGYTAMSERLDPEEVKEITTHIFSEISKIVGKYEGFIEKYAGDAVMALFGADAAHEDDPVRAISAAREIHNLVNSLSPKYEERSEQPLSMHSGINTGLVVTGEVNLERGTHGVAGDTINVAARLSALGNAGDILVTADTYAQTDGYFDFKELESAKIKGKTAPVRIFKVLSQKDQPVKIHRLQGLKAELIGRKVEIKQLSDAVQKLKAGTSSVFTICGTAGTGKSRLIQEFKESLNHDEIQWLEGQAFPFSQNMPYFPLINLLNRAFQIKEGDSPDVTRNKIETAISSLIEEKTDVVPYIGTLFSLSYPEVEEVSPEFWQTQLQQAVQTLLSALARQRPLVVCLEDLHWSDPSFLELVRLIFTEFREPVLFLCSYRPVISLLTSHQISAMANSYREIRLQDLSPTESQSMVESLLNTDTIPADLQQFVQDKVEGNPFYLEEVINSLIETGALIQDNGDWRITRPIIESDISSTIHGVITGRLDRLEKETKRLLQEASVIGRTFLYQILNRITELKDHIDRSLNGLERLDLIRARALQPDLEYIFKHALTQEVVYNGLLKKERQKIHERIGSVMEQLFEDRLPEFYETLAYHFARSESPLKAVDYLVKSGEKSLKRYAVEESHQYFEQAYMILANRSGTDEKEMELLIDLILKWALVFYYRGDINGLQSLLSRHGPDAQSIQDRSMLGMFKAWTGFSLFNQGKRLDESYQHLQSAAQMGQKIGDPRVVGYALTWLTWVCTELGKFDEAFSCGERALKIAKDFPTDHYLNFKPLGGLGWAYGFQGDADKAIEYGKISLEYGQKHANVRAMVMGYYGIGLGYQIKGDMPSAIETFKKATLTSKDPLYGQAAQVFLGISYILSGQYEKAEDLLRDGSDFYRRYGNGLTGMPADAGLGAVLISQGRMTEGLNKIKDAARVLSENHRKGIYISAEYMLGNLYLQIVLGEGPKSLALMAKNIGFIIKNVPQAAKKAEQHLGRTIELSEEIGSRQYLGPAYLDLGRLHKAKKRTDQALHCLSRAMNVFEQNKAETLFKQAKEEMESVK